MYTWQNALADGLGFKSCARLFHQAAALRAGTDDFGDQGYLTGFMQLLVALDARPPATLAKRLQAGGVIEMALVGRAHAVAGFARHLQGRAIPVPAPVFIIGLPRSGTTALHHLLSQDPQFQGLERWLSRTPQPRPPRATWGDNPAYQDACAEVATRMRLAPDAHRAHEIAAETVDECLIALSQSFVSNWFGSNMDVPAYDEWHWEQDETPAYRHLSDVLRLIGLNDNRLWLLKNPGHVWGIDALLRVFPTAKIVHIHRDPARSVPSLVNLLASLRQADDAERGRIATREVRYWAAAAARSVAASQRDPARFIHVDFDAFGADPLGIAQRIYQKFDLTLSPEALLAMRGWVTTHPRPCAPVHEYPLAIGAWDTGAIRKAFSPYVAQHFPALVRQDTI